MSIAISISNSVKGALVPGGGGVPFVNEYSMTFDGISDYALGGSTFSTLNGVTKMSLSCWVKPTLNSIDEVISCGYASGVLFQLRIYNTGVVRFQFNTTSFYTTTGAGAISANVWSHVLICIDKTLGTSAERGRIFINGVENQSNNLNTVAMGTATTPLYIGVGYGITNPYEGLVDEVAFWSGSDLRSESSAIYNGGVPFDLGSYSTVPDHYYRMGDGDGDPTWSTNLTDNTGSYNLTSSMPADARLPISPSSYSQNSFVFDGINDFVNLGNDASRKVQTLTMSVWVKPTAFASDPILLNGHPSYGNQGIEIFWNFNLFRVRINGTGYGLGAGSGQNNWTHIVISYDGNTLKRMVNGVQGADVVVGATINYTNYNGLKLGRSVYGYALGLIDEVAFWDSDQSANFSTIYGNGVPTDILSLSPLNYYRMGESATWDGANWTFVDQGSGGNDGTSSTLPESAKTGDQPYVL